MLLAPFPITLTDADLAEADEADRFIQDRAKARGYKDHHGYTGDPDAISRPGMRVEMAFARGMNYPFCPDFDGFKGPDFGKKIQVRGAPCRNEYPPKNFGNMYFTTRDNPDHWYTLIVGNGLNYVCKGWLPGKKCKEVGWWGSMDPDRPPCWWVNHSLLDLDMTPLLPSGMIEILA